MLAEGAICGLYDAQPVELEHLTHRAKTPLRRLNNNDMVAS